MGHDLEAPFQDGNPTWASLYRAREGDVSEFRPVFTGDVYNNVSLEAPTGEARSRSVLVVQHPCSMRIDGVNLANKLLVAELSNRKPLEQEAWLGNYGLMPLPDLRPNETSGRRHQAASFDNLHVVRSADLRDRIACLSPVGVNLLLQRWVHFSSRVVVPTWQLQETIEGEYEEADLTEDWCTERHGLDLAAAMRECVDWLRDESKGPTRQQRLRQPQQRSSVRAEMRVEIRRLRDQESRASKS
jgi:hypothetical protein